MPVEFWPAFIAGVIGAAVMVAMGKSMKAMGAPLDMDIIRLWGTMLKLHGGAMQLAGWLIHLVGSGVIALLYAWAFDLLALNDHLWFWGLVGGAINWIIAGLFMAILPPMHPEIPEQRHAPGAFVLHYGAVDVAGFLMTHLVFGVVVGVLYGYWHSAGGWNVVF